MAANLVQAVQKSLMDHLTGQVAFTMPTSPLEISLHTASPGEAGSTANEMAGTGGYIRKTATFTTPVSAAPYVVFNVAAITFPVATADWAPGPVTDVGVHDAAVGKQMLAYATLGASRTVLNGDTLSFAANALTLSLD